MDKWQRFVLILVVCFGLIAVVLMLEPAPHRHTVTFDMQIDSLAWDYASYPLARGELSNADRWVWVFYLYGGDSDGMTGRLQVLGTDPVTHRAVYLSNPTQPLSAGRLYRVSWYWDEATGGALSVNGVSTGLYSPGFTLKDNASETIHIGDEMYNGGGRTGSTFAGTVSNITVVEHDTDTIVYAT
jgi:hypothetical protein